MRIGADNLTESFCGLEHGRRKPYQPYRCSGCSDGLFDEREEVGIRTVEIGCCQDAMEAGAVASFLTLA